MRCLGLVKNLRRCRRPASRWLFCHDHTRQPLVWLAFFIFTVLAGTASILSAIRTSHPLPIQREPITVYPTPVSIPSTSTSQPTPQSFVTPNPETPEKPRPKREDPHSAHLPRAKALYTQGKYQEAMGECDAELRLNPNNTEALTLRKRIARTIKILNQ